MRTASTRTPIEMLYHWEQTTPNRVYLRQPIRSVWHEFTWRQVADQSRRIANALISMDLPQGSRIAIAGRNTAHWFMADFAIQMAGHVSVGLYPKQPTDTARYILEHADVQAIFIGPMEDPQSILDAIPRGCKRIALPYPDVGKADVSWNELLKTHAPLQKNPVPTADALFTLVYTSGTTGNPKGVMLSYRNVMTAVTGATEAIQPNQERLFSYLPLAHIFERAVVEINSLYNNCQVSFLEELKKFPVQLPQVAPTMFVAVPAVWTRLQHGILEKLPQKKLDRLLRLPVINKLIRKKILTALGLQNVHFAITGAAPIPLAQLKWWRKLGLTIHEGYAMSENTAYAFINYPGKARFGSVGQCMPGSECKIAENGEILIRNAAVTQGYYLEAEKTAETISADGWLHTGDKGHLDEDGYLFITGRVKDIFKTVKGKYVAPAPIEGLFASNADLESMCLVGSGLQQPVLLVSLSEEAQQKDRQDIEQGLRDTLDKVNATMEPHELVNAVVITADSWSIDNGYLTPTMKVKRNVIEDHYAALITDADGQRNSIIWE